jgi:hypothetical protein
MGSICSSENWLSFSVRLLIWVALIRAALVRAALVRAAVFIRNDAIVTVSFRTSVTQL